MASDGVLVLMDHDAEGNGMAVAGHLKSIHLIYKKLKLGVKKEPTPLVFDAG